MTLPTVSFVGTGGTIASVGRSPLDTIEYLEANQMLDLESLLEHVPWLGEICIPRLYPFAPVSSMAMGPEQWLALAEVIGGALKEDIAGIVVSHGTSTLEETAFFLDLVIDDPRPVVITGAMRPISALSSDGHLNLIDAAQVASDEGSRGLGALVVMSGRIHAARYATKLSTYSVEAFGAANGGVMGEVLGSDVHYFTKPERLRKMTPVIPLPRVDLLISYPGSDGFAIDAAIEKQAKGIVMAGFGPGDVNAAELEALRRARSLGIQIIQASRTMGGQVLTRSDLKRDGFIAAGRLTPQKARVLAIVAISVGLAGPEMQQVFNDVG